MESVSYINFILLEMHIYHEITLGNNFYETEICLNNEFGNCQLYMYSIFIYYFEF